jgi:RNA polymerase sigma-70 factor (ECF subfamily)
MEGDSMEREATHVWEQLHNALRRFISRRVSHEAEIDDILQNVFLRVHQHLESLQDRERMVPWVYQITRNAIIDYYRSAERGRERPSGLAADLMQEQAEESSVAHDTETRYELARCLRPMIDQLSAEYRDAIMLVEIDGLTHQAAAQKLGLSLPGMKSRVQRGRRLLKHILDDCCVIQLDSRRGVAHFEPRHPNSCE